MQSEKVISSIDVVFYGNKSIRILNARNKDLFFVPTSDLRFLMETIASVLDFEKTSLFLLLCVLDYLSFSFLLMFSKI